MWSLPSAHDIRGGFGSDSETNFEPISKRRRSGESAFSNLASRMVTRFPSLSRRARERKNTGRAARSEPSSVVTSPVIGRSRSNSRQGSILGRSMSSEMDVDCEQIAQAPLRIATIAEVEDQEAKPAESLPFSHAGLQVSNAQELERSETPLLPPTADEELSPQLMQSPLASPKIDWTSVPASLVNTPVDTPQLTSMASPALSTKPSLSAMNRSQQTSPIEPPSDVVSMLIDEDDEWSDRLGHANFHIRPSPYLPELCNAQTCGQLFKDWERARCEYGRHLARTSTHFGQASRVYRLTEEKWSEIDQQWKENHGIARSTAMGHGDCISINGPLEPAQVVRVPELEAGKFPKLEDEGIVGAMPVQEPPSQSTPPLSRHSSKRAQLKNVIGGLQRRNRSMSGPRA